MSKEKTVEEKVLGGELVTGNFELSAQLSNGKSIRMSGYIYAHNSRESIDRQVDLFCDVIERQRIKAEIPMQEAKLDQLYIQMDQWHANIKALEAKKDSGKLSSSDKQQLHNGMVSLEMLAKEVEKGKLAIAENKAKVA